VDIGFHDYQHVRAPSDGTVKIDGVERPVHTARSRCSRPAPFRHSAITADAFLRRRQGPTGRRVTCGEVSASQLRT
jgi:hypothetical protein